MAASSPTLLKRYIALELRRLRNAAPRDRGTGYDRNEVAARLRCNRSHVTHLEIQRNLPNASELEVLLNLYGVPERVPAFLELLEAARSGQDWWLPFKGAAPEWFDLFLGMEAGADQIKNYSAMVVHGLLQTAAYAEAIIRAGEPQLTDKEVEHRVELRMARQDVFYRPPKPPTLWFVLDESVLHRGPVRQPKALVEQLEHLAERAQEPHVNLRLLPFDAGLHAGVNGPFAILTFGPELEGDPGVAYSESRIRGTYWETEEEIARYQDTFTRVQDLALPFEKTRAVLARRIKEITR